MTHLIWIICFDDTKDISTGTDIHAFPLHLVTPEMIRNNVVAAEIEDQASFPYTCNGEDKEIDHGRYNQKRL